jgi:hypothetical protein
MILLQALHLVLTPCCGIRLHSVSAGESHNSADESCFQGKRKLRVVQTKVASDNTNALDYAPPRPWIITGTVRAISLRSSQID